MPRKTPPKTPETPVMKPSSPIVTSTKSPSSYGSTTSSSLSSPFNGNNNTSRTDNSNNVYFQVPTSLSTTPSESGNSSDSELQQAIATSLTPATAAKNPRERGNSPTDVKDVEHLLKKPLLDPTKKLFFYF